MKTIRLIKDIVFAFVLLVILAVPLVARGDPGDALTMEEDFYKNLHKSVVFISAENDSRSVAAESTGTGFIATKDGMVITSAHVVAGKNKFSIIFNNGETKSEKRSARIILSDRFIDIAVLKIVTENNETFEPLSFGDQQELVSGFSDITVAGYPIHLGGEKLYIGSGKVTQREILLNTSFGVGGRGHYIATNIIGSGGNSGGPCFYKNRIVGVAGTMNVDLPKNITGPLACVASISVKQVLAKAIAGESIIRGHLDVTLGRFDMALAAELGRHKDFSKEPPQVFVIDPRQSNLRPLDLIRSITYQDATGGHVVPVRYVADVERTFGNVSPGTFITMRIVRAGDEMKVRLLVQPFIEINYLH